MLHSYKILTLAFIGFLCFAPANFAQAEMSKTEIEKIIENYIMENPQLIIDSVENHRRQASSVEQGQALIKHHRPLFKDDTVPFAGKKDGDVTIIEFFDYNCGYCKRALPSVQALLKEDTNVRFTFMELPILGPSSETASRWALAAQKQGKYLPFHIALMESREKFSEDSLSKIAKSMDLDVDLMRKDANSDEISAVIKKNRGMARDLGVNGTPGFIIGGQVIPGALSLDDIKKYIKEARAKK